MNIRLTDLEPELLTYIDTRHRRRDAALTLDTADGIIFLCPKCYLENGKSKVGVHSVICWFEGRVPDDATPGPGRWTPRGTGFADLTFVPGERHKPVSVRLLGGCQWHGHIANGNVT